MNLEEMQYVKYIVYRYLKTKPELQEFKEDLVQEGYMELLKAKEEYNSSLSDVPIDLYVYYKVLHGIQNYIRSEAKHFKKPPSDHESPYWDLPDFVDVELIAAPAHDAALSELMKLVDHIEITQIQRDIFESYLRTGSYAETGRELGYTRQRVALAIGAIVKKAKALIDKQVS